MYLDFFGVLELVFCLGIGIFGCVVNLESWVVISKGNFEVENLFFVVVEFFKVTNK